MRTTRWRISAHDFEAIHWTISPHYAYHQSRPMPGFIQSIFSRGDKRRQALAAAHVVPEAIRCVQCGICSFSCPIEIDVRAHARAGKPVVDSYCLSCGECVSRCPRGVLRFEASSIFAQEGTR